ncbi:unnamed protein product [Caenorhabditis brenneri]
MGRDVQYSPFSTWHTNQSTVHSRFLKFLLVVIILSVVSFYIGYPDANIDETPKTEPQEYRAREISINRYSESTRNDEVPIQTASTIVQNTANQTLKQAEIPEFNDSRVPSGPSFGEEKLKILEEQERKIIESQEMGTMKDGHQEDLTVADVGVGAPVSEETVTEQTGSAETTTTTAGQNSEMGPVEEATTKTDGEDSTTSAIGSTEYPTTENSESQSSTSSDTTGPISSTPQSQEPGKTEESGPESEVQPSTSSDASNDDHEPAPNSDGPETEQSEFSTTSSSFTTSATNHIEIDDAEKQVEQVSSNLTAVVEGSEGNLEVSTITSEAGNVTEIGSQLGQAGQENQENEQKMFENLSDCHVEDWNNVTTDQIPHQSVFKQWLLQNPQPDSNDTETPKVLGAFVYQSHIAVTLSSRNFSTGKLYCRYYDCHKKQMVRQMVSFVFPESTVYCPRRAGAKYISISESLEDKGQYPVQILKRLVPHHFFTVCVASQGENILELARFIEYYKLQGSTFFHVYLKNSSHYQRMLLDDYVRTGDVMVVKIGENVTEEVMANDCQHRNKYFSKWTAFLNLEDQLEAKEDAETISSVLDSIHDHKTNILKWGNDTTRLIIRPERIVSINQSPMMVYLGSQLSEESSGVLKKFTTSSDLTPENFSESLAEDVPFREELVENVLTRTKYVFTTIETDNQNQNPVQEQDQKSTTIESTTESLKVDYSNIDNE